MSSTVNQSVTSRDRPPGESAKPPAPSASLAKTRSPAVLVRCLQREADRSVPGDGGAHVGHAKHRLHGRDRAHRGRHGLRRGRRGDLRLAGSRRAQATHRLAVTAQHRGGERGATALILGLQIGAEIDEQAEEVVAAQLQREVERRLPALEARHAAPERLGVVLDELLDERRIPHRERRENVMAGAALDEEGEHVGADRARPAERGRPADDVGLVHVALAVDIGPGIEQRAHDLEVTAAGGDVQRAGVVAAVAGVGIGAALEEQADGLQVTGGGGEVEAGASVKPAALAHQGEIMREQVPDGGEVAPGARLEEGIGHRCAPLLDEGPQRAPARQPVLAGHHQLRGGQLGPRICGAQLAKSVLGELAQVLERRAWRELRGRHGHLPSISRPVSAISGRKSGSSLFSDGEGASGWVRPFTRTVGRPTTLQLF